MVLFANVDFPRGSAPGWGAKAAAQLEADIKAGRRGSEDLQGPRAAHATKADGSRLKVDDPELDPVWAAAGARVPVLIHTAEPQEFFEPIDCHERALARAGALPRRRYPAGAVPAFEELLAERDRMFRSIRRRRSSPRTSATTPTISARLGKLLERCRTSTPKSARSSPSSAASRARRTTSS